MAKHEWRRIGPGVTEHAQRSRMRRELADRAKKKPDAASRAVRRIVKACDKTLAKRTPAKAEHVEREWRILWGSKLLRQWLGTTVYDTRQEARDTCCGGCSATGKVIRVEVKVI